MTSGKINTYKISKTFLIYQRRWEVLQLVQYEQQQILEILRACNKKKWL